MILIERKAAALAVIRENLASLDIGGEVTVLRGSASVLLPNYPGDIVFVDPPYDQEDEYRKALLALAGTPCKLAIAQHTSRLELAIEYGGLARTRVLRQGDNSLSFYEPANRI